MIKTVRKVRPGTETGSLLLFGPTSILGSALLRHVDAARVQVFCNPFARATPPHWHRLDLVDPAAIRSAVRAHRPRLVLYCGGICDVDKCEADPDFARRINVDAVATLLAELPGDARLVYCSSDHVFGGRDAPYWEDSPPEPLTVYGRDRVTAERLVLAADHDSLVIRSGLAIGPSHDGRSGHLDWLRYRSARGLPITLVADEVRSVVWARDLAARVWQLAESDTTGIRHMVAARPIDRPTLAAYLCEHFGIQARYRVTNRNTRRLPHLGRVELRSRFTDHLAAPLPAVIPPFTSR